MVPAPIQLLVVSFTFPPDSEVGAQRVARLCRYLPEFGIRPIVLTVDERFYARRDASSFQLGDLHIERTGMTTTPLEAYARWKSRRRTPASQPADRPAEAIEQQAAPGALKRHVLALLKTPDAYWGWYFPAVRAGLRLMEQESIDAIFSTAPPWTSHLVARKLARKSGRPWFADFRDPWWGNPQRKNLPKWRDFVDHRLEAGCVRLAASVVCNTDRMRQFYAGRYAELPAAKFFTLTNGFDDLFQPAQSERTDARRLILHLGDIYGVRRIDSFCDAVVQLVATGRLDPRAIRILFLGTIDPEIEADARRRLESLLPTGCVEFRPRVGWDAAQRELWRADLLLLFQGGFRLQVPAKFYEYLHTGKPILAVVEEGALTDIVDATQAGVWCDPSDPNSIGNAFLRALQLPARAPMQVEQQFSSQYHYRAIAGRLASKLRQAVGRNDIVEAG